MALPSRALDSVSFQVAGGDPALKAQLQGASLLQNAQVQKVTAPREILAAALADYARLTETLYASGYYGGVIHILLDGREAASIPVFSAPGQIRVAAIVIDPGPPFRFAAAQVAPLAPGTVLPDGFRSGEIARSGLIQQAVDSGVGGWRDAGHAKAALTSQSITASHADSSLSALLRLDPGPRLRFGRLYQTSGSAVRPDRVQRIAGLPGGAVFSPAALARSAQRLRRTGAFSSVSLQEAALPGPDGTLDIDLVLVDAKPRRLGFGAEISSLEGLTVSAYWMHRNLFGGAERFRIDGEVSGIAGQSGGIDYHLDARLEQPATFGPDTKAFVFASAAYEDEPAYLSWFASLGGGATWIVSEELEAELGVALRYSETQDGMGNRSFFLLTLPVSAAWDRRDNALNPVSGVFLRGEATPFVSLRGLGGGARLFADGRAYRGLGRDDRFVVAGRVQAGAVLASAAATIPPEYLFYSGGGNTVRGHPYKSLAVDLGGGNFTGGQAFLAASAEMRAAVTDTIGVVGFVDAGYIGATGFFDGNDGWHAGAGLGLRYQTAIGPIRLDVAAPVAGDTGAGVQIYLGIGQAF